MNRSKHILIIRFSALGDVAMAAPMVRQAAEAFPQIRFTMVSRPFLQPLFEGLPNLHFIGANVDKDYNGLRGLWKLFRILRAQRPSRVADIHSVLRTHVLSFFFRVSGTRVATIKKGRREKKALTRRENKRLRPLKTSFERYREAIEKCIGAKIPADQPFQIPTCKSAISFDAPKAIGIAPFAAYGGKIYPLEKMEEVVNYFAATRGILVFLFGAGHKERDVLEAWETRYPNVQSMAGKIKLSEELALMQQLSVMITMDSANMHLASFVGTPVVSVWGATHPYAGFYGWRQLPENIVSLPLACRPCSVYGNKPCFRHDYYCLNALVPEDIIEKVERLLHD